MGAAIDNFEQVFLVGWNTNLAAGFMPSVQEVVGDVDVRVLETIGEDQSLVEKIGDGLILVPEQGEGDSAVATLQRLREAGCEAPAIVFAEGDREALRSELAGSAPVGVVDGTSFSASALRSELEGLGYSTAPASDSASAADGVADAATDDPEPVPEAKAIRDEDGAQLAALTALWKRRQEQVLSLGERTVAAELALREQRQQLSQVQEALTAEKRQRWEVILDLREGQEHITELEEKLQASGKAATQAKKDLDTLLVEMASKDDEIAKLTKNAEEATAERATAETALDEEKGRSKERIAKLEETEETLSKELKDLREEDKRKERQVASLKSKVVELEVVREEVQQGLREPSGLDASARLAELEGERNELERSLASARSELERLRSALNGQSGEPKGAGKPGKPAESASAQAPAGPAKQAPAPSADPPPREEAPEAPKVAKEPVAPAADVEEPKAAPEMPVLAPESRSDRKGDEAIRSLRAALGDLD